jgi:serine/threonine protein kinase
MDVCSRLVAQSDEWLDSEEYGMPDPHWQNLKEIFHAALALPPHARASFIENSSKGDESLRKSLESLLKSHEEANNFLDAPAYQATAELLIDRAQLRPGQLVGHYRILNLLGEGGMGRVYLAEDTKLHRRVCLKFLSARFTSNPEWLRRFEQEARAASALNNPNILTIYEIGEADGHDFIATEFIEGQTLRERLRNGIDLRSAIDTAIQIASALVAAHRVNIVHRDIKPENVMIRDEDGLVKVLDFGLAKISVDESTPVSVTHDVNVNDISMTNPGVLMGTVAYMSPEQASGEVVDPRTDIWSLGVVLYEMVRGRQPFTGNSSHEIISAIVSKEPSLVTEPEVGEVPEEVALIISKALQKQKEKRYLSSQELLDALKTCSEVNRIGRSAHQEQAPSSAEYVFNKFRTHKRGAVAVASIVLLAILSGVAVYGWRAKHTGTVELKEVHPTDPKASEFYSRGVIGLDERGFDKEALPHMLDTITFFKKAIEIDPQYASAHAQLAIAYAWTAIFIEPGETKWVGLARAEIERSKELNPNLPESHLARGLLLWSPYEGYQNVEALREFRLAKQLNPKATIPDLPAIYAHVGLDELAQQELDRQLEGNPTSMMLHGLSFILLYLRADTDAWLALRQKLSDPQLSDTQLNDAPLASWYYLRKGRLDDAQKVIDEQLAKNGPDTQQLLLRQGQLLALRGNFRAAQARASEILTNTQSTINESRHHLTYDAACIYALAGNTTEAVRWLRETAATGFPNYPLFARDPFLNRIRQAPEFVQFMAEQKAQWESFRQEFQSP